MADQITIDIGITYNDSTAAESPVTQRKTGFLVTQSSPGKFLGEIPIPIAAAGTAITFPNITTPGYLYAESLEPDGGNFVEFGRQVAGTFYEVNMLHPLWPMAVGNATTALFGRSDTGIVTVRFYQLEF